VASQQRLENLIEPDRQGREQGEAAALRPNQPTLALAIAIRASKTTKKDRHIHPRIALPSMRVLPQAMERVTEV